MRGSDWTRMWWSTSFGSEFLIDQKRTWLNQKWYSKYKLWLREPNRSNKERQCVDNIIGNAGGKLGYIEIRCIIFYTNILRNEKWNMKREYDSLFTPSKNIVFIGPESDHWECLSLTHWLTNSLLFSKLDWCDPGVWRCQRKNCWML